MAFDVKCVIILIAGKKLVYLFNYENNGFFHRLFKRTTDNKICIPTKNYSIDRKIFEQFSPIFSGIYMVESTEECNNTMVRPVLHPPPPA